MTDAVLGPRDRRRAATRQNIQAAALRLFLDRGFEAVTVEQVAEAANFSARTIYRYFPTKEDLVLADLAQRQDEALVLIDRHPGGTTIGEMLRESFLEWASNSRDPRLLRSESALIEATPALMARMLHMMAKWEVSLCARIAARSGRLETDLAVRQLALVYSGTVRIVVQEFAAANIEGDIAAFALAAFESLVELPTAQLPASGQVRQDHTL